MGEPTSSERRRHVRGSLDRADRHVTLRYRLRGTSHWLTTVTQNISLGGAFLRDLDFAPTTEIDVELSIPNRSEPLCLVAEVRWTSDGAGRCPTGVGVQFCDLDIDIMMELNRYLASLPVPSPTATPAGTPRPPSK